MGERCIVKAGFEGNISSLLFTLGVNGTIQLGFFGFTSGSFFGLVQTLAHSSWHTRLGTFHHDFPDKFRGVNARKLTKKSSSISVKVNEKKKRLEKVQLKLETFKN